MVLDQRDNGDGEGDGEEGGDGEESGDGDGDGSTSGACVNTGAATSPVPPPETRPATQTMPLYVPTITTSQRNLGMNVHQISQAKSRATPITTSPSRHSSPLIWRG